MNKLRNLLLQSFDRELSEKERQKLENALANSPELRREQEQIAAMRGMLANAGQESFRPLFAERVMNRLTTILPRQKTEPDLISAMFFMFKRVALTGVIVLAVLVSVQWSTWNKAGNAVQTQQISDMTLDEVLTTAFTASLEELL